MVFVLLREQPKKSGFFPFLVILERYSTCIFPRYRFEQFKSQHAAGTAVWASAALTKKTKRVSFKPFRHSQPPRPASGLSPEPQARTRLAQMGVRTNSGFRTWERQGPNRRLQRCFGDEEGACIPLIYIYLFQRPWPLAKANGFILYYYFFFMLIINGAIYFDHKWSYLFLNGLFILVSEFLPGIISASCKALKSIKGSKMDLRSKPLV
jgi:hypothetical protein